MACGRNTVRTGDLMAHAGTGWRGIIKQKRKVWHSCAWRSNCQSLIGSARPGLRATRAYVEGGVEKEAAGGVGEESRSFGPTVQDKTGNVMRDVGDRDLW
jgi:hypothetical protein